MGRKRWTILLAAALLLLAGAEAFAEYNRDAVVKVMRDNVVLLGRLRESAGRGDFIAAADHLWTLAGGMRSIRMYTPPKGGKEAWDRTIDQLVSAAYRGIGACGDRDPARLNAAVTELNNAMRTGHSLFR